MATAEEVEREEAEMRRIRDMVGSAVANHFNRSGGQITTEQVEEIVAKALKEQKASQPEYLPDGRVILPQGYNGPMPGAPNTAGLAPGTYPYTPPATPPSAAGGARAGRQEEEDAVLDELANYADRLREELAHANRDMAPSELRNLAEEIVARAYEENRDPNELMWEMREANPAVDAYLGAVYEQYGKRMGRAAPEGYTPEQLEKALLGTVDRKGDPLTKDNLQEYLTGLEIAPATKPKPDDKPAAGKTETPAKETSPDGAPGGASTTPNNPPSGGKVDDRPAGEIKAEAIEKTLDE